MVRSWPVSAERRLIMPLTLLGDKQTRAMGASPVPPPCTGAQPCDRSSSRWACRHRTDSTTCETGRSVFVEWLVVRVGAKEDLGPELVFLLDLAGIANEGAENAMLIDEAAAGLARATRA